MESLAQSANPAALMAAVLAASAMGYAIQHGGTCMVAAVDQALRERRFTRALALAECSLWVAVLGMIAMAAGFSTRASPDYTVGPSVALGGLLLGLGAWTNGACVFGSIARIGLRQWHYLLTPLGFFLGSLLHARLVGPFPPQLPALELPRLSMIAAFLLCLSLIVTAHQFIANRNGVRSPKTLWDYRHATIAIGIAFVVLTALAGPWTYSELLARSAHGGGSPPWQDGLLFVALLAGSVIGGSKSGSGVGSFSASCAQTCLIGGAMMGFGGAMVPGGNDNLILVGLPGLQPHAWLAIAAMVLGITMSLLVGPRLRKMLDAGLGGRTGPA